MPKSVNPGSDNGLHLGATLQAPAEFDSGLHLGEWMRGEGGLHLGQLLRLPEQPHDLIVNGDFSQPGVGVFPETSVPGWYVPGPLQDVTIATNLFGVDNPHAVIPLTTATAFSPTTGMPTSWVGELAQDVDAATGQTYTLQWQAWFDFSQLGPHVDGVTVLWDGQTITGAEIARSGALPAYWATFEATVVGQPGVDTVTFQSIAFTRTAGGAMVDNVSLTPTATHATTDLLGLA